ncbi:MAG: peroxide stress protein YaaA [Pseudomonadota bacterium]
MLVVVSPAKKLDMTPMNGMPLTEPGFPEDTKELAGVARKMSANKLKKLMHISDSLAQLNYERFQDFGNMERKAAALAFAGDTYLGLEASSLDRDEMTWAQGHLRILSGLYGMLRPLDAIEPYRLEMGSKVVTKRGKSLYDFWGDRISRALNTQAEETKSDTLVNCASQEYFGAVNLDALQTRVITPVFMERKMGATKIISFYAKRARGAMARFVVQKRLTNADDLRDFDIGGYAYNEAMSEPDKPVFVREHVDT